MSFAETIARFDGLPEGQRIDHYRSAEFDSRAYLIAEMHARGWRQRDLVGEIGSRAKVSEVLAGTRRLSVAMIRRLVRNRGLSAHMLLEVHLKEASE